MSCPVKVASDRGRSPEGNCVRDSADVNDLRWQETIQISL